MKSNKKYPLIIAIFSIICFSFYTINANSSNYATVFYNQNHNFCRIEGLYCELLEIDKSLGIKTIAKNSLLYKKLKELDTIYFKTREMLCTISNKLADEYNLDIDDIPVIIAAETTESCYTSPKGQSYIKRYYTLDQELEKIISTMNNLIAENRYSIK